MPGYSRVVLVLTLLGLGTVAAADGIRLRPGMTGVADLGATSCETFNHMYPAGPTGLRQAALYYAEGFIYGRSGKTLEQVVGGLPDDAGWTFDSLTDVMVNYCTANPAAEFADAAAALWAALGG
jgi:hypothetical protein